MRRAAVLLWKEWREQRLLFLAVVSFVTLVVVGYGLSGNCPHAYVLYFCCAVAAWVLGAAAGDELAGALASLITASPVRPSLLWAAKLLVGLAATAAAAGIAAALTCVFSLSAGEVRLVDLSLVVWICLFGFSVSHYYACCLRSPIAALGMGFALVAGLAVCAWLSPIWKYVSVAEDAVPDLFALLMRVLGVILLVLGAWRFVANTKRREQTTRAHRVLWLVLPFLVLGVVPLASGYAIFVADALRLDPTDMMLLNGVSVAPDRRSAVAFGTIDQSGGLLRLIPQHQVALTVSPSDGRVSRLCTVPRGQVSRPPRWSPSSRYLATTLRDPHGRSERMVVLDTATGQFHRLDEHGQVQLLTWLSEDSLLLLRPDKGGGTGLCIWNAWDQSAKPSALLESLRGSAMQFIGFASEPTRAVFCDGSEATLFDPRTGHASSLPLPGRYLCGAPLRGGRHLVLRPLRQNGNVASAKAPVLLDLATRQTLSLTRLLGAEPRAGWQAFSMVQAEHGRWLLIVPREHQTDEPQQWYAVDLANLEVFRHGLPAPHFQLFLSSQPAIDGRLANLAPAADGNGSVPVLIDLRDPSPSGRLALVLQARRWSISVTSMTWLSANELMLAVKANPLSRHQPYLGLRTPDSVAMLVADLRTRRVRTLWADRHPDVRWRITPWPEWKHEVRPGVVLCDGQWLGY